MLDISKNRQVELICENSKCHKAFKRSLNNVSFRNFCSQACYGTLVTLRNKSKAKSFKYCLYCGTRIEGKFVYCSPKCWGLKHKTSKDDLINKLQKLAQKLGRSPTRRECSFDWSLSKNILVEYFGLANDSRRYDEEIKKKQQICKE